MKKSAALPRRSLCAVVPAAGRGTRLGANIPKVFVPLFPGVTIWDAVRGKLSPLADRIVLILSPDGQTYLKDNRADFKSESFEKTEVALQPSALGMGDAIFGAYDFWREYDDVLIVWGDQFNLSPRTLAGCLDVQANTCGPTLTLPVVRIKQPYVEYVFNPGGRLTHIRQSREGDVCESDGFSDVGVFLLSGGQELRDEWSRFQASAATGSVTGEVNFLPFLIHLSSCANWRLNRYETHDPNEALGINTPEDLAFARRLLHKMPQAP